jgi:hypothetical protein
MKLLKPTIGEHMTPYTRITIDGMDVRILHDALLMLMNSNDHKWESQRVSALLVQLMRAAERMGVKVEV